MARKNTSKEIITKKCTRTGKTYRGTRDEIAVHFYRDKSQKDGFSPWSKDAERAYNKAYRAALNDAEIARKKDGDDKAVVTFDNVMKKAGVRTSRSSKVSRDGTRTTKAKARTTSRAKARKAKGKAKGAKA